MQKQPFQNNKNKVNNEVKAPYVRVIQNGKSIGVLSNYDAKKLAFESGLDLVEIKTSEKTPVCLIVDFGKYQYEQKKKIKEAKSQKSFDMKCLRITPVIEKHDIDLKIRQAKTFLLEGKPVKIVMKFKPVQLNHSRDAVKIFDEIVLGLKDVGKMDSVPKFEDRKSMSVKFLPLVQN